MKREEEMEMPTPCAHCGGWFDLKDGYSSEKWYSGIVICEGCHTEEEAEVERDDEIEELNSQIEDAQHTIASAQERLKELEVKPWLD